MSLSKPDGMDGGPGAANLAYVEGLYEDYLRDPGSVSPEWREYLAGFAAKRAADSAEREAAREARKAKKKVKAPKPKAPKAAKPTPPRRIERVSSAQAMRHKEIGIPKGIVAPPARLMTSDEFLAMGGQVERLAVGAVSKPFRAIGFNNREAA